MFVWTLSQGWYYGALCFCIACSRGSLGCHAVLHVAGVQKTWIRSHCRAAGKVMFHDNEKCREMSRITPKIVQSVLVIGGN